MKLTIKSYTILLLFSLSSLLSVAQINTDRVMNIGRNALYFEDYILSMQYFNQVIKVKPYMAEPYFYRGVAKLSLDDFTGAEEDCTSLHRAQPLYRERLPGERYRPADPGRLSRGHRRLYTSRASLCPRGSYLS